MVNQVPQGMEMFLHLQEIHQEMGIPPLNLMEHILQIPPQMMEILLLNLTEPFLLQTEILLQIVWDVLIPVIEDAMEIVKKTAIQQGHVT